MSIREWATFTVDLFHIVLLGVVYVAGLSVQTLFAALRRAWTVPDAEDEARPGRPVADSRTE